jgi:hypothetical protein
MRSPLTCGLLDIIRKITPDARKGLAKQGRVFCVNTWAAYRCINRAASVNFPKSI